MFEIEAKWLRDRLENFKNSQISPLLNLGSSDYNFRTREQPWIDKEIFAPLRKREVKTCHVDLKDSKGVDISADLMTQEGFERLHALNPRSILCSNMLEHVTDPRLLASRIEQLLPDEGYAFITVPYSYPYHKDPIDTMYRPTPWEVAEIFPQCELLNHEILATGSYRQEIRKRPLIIFRHIFIFPFPFFAWERWKRSMRKLRWLFTPYKVSCVVLQKKRKNSGPEA